MSKPKDTRTDAKTTGETTGETTAAPPVPSPPRAEDLLKALATAAGAGPKVRKRTIQMHNLIGSLVGFYTDAIADMAAEYEEREQALLARLGGAERALLVKGDTRTISLKHVEALEGLLERAQRRNDAAVLSDAELEALHFAVYTFGGRTNPRA